MSVPIELGSVVSAALGHPGVAREHLGAAVREVPVKELAERALALAAEWRQGGRGPGSRIGVHGRNGLGWIVADLAILSLGAVLAPEPGPVEGGFDASLAPTGDYLRVPTRIHRWRPDEFYTFKQTSGSTSASKRVPCRVSHFDAVSRGVVDLFGIGGSDLVGVFLPLSSWLQRTLLQVAILRGADICLSRTEFGPLAIEAFRPTLVGGVPALLRSVHDRARKREVALVDAWGGRIRSLWTGSAPISPALLQEYLEAGLPVHEGYGMSETGFIAKNHPSANRLGSVGRPYPGIQIRFDQDGQLLVHSDSLPFESYDDGSVGDPPVFLGGGWVATGDRASLDAEGFLHLEGRIRGEIVLSTGKKVVSETVERALKLEAGIRECVLFGNGRPFLGVLVQTEAGTGLDLARRAVERWNSAAEDHRRIHVVLPLAEQDSFDNWRTENGKIRRQAIIDSHQAAIIGAYGGC